MTTQTVRLKSGARISKLQYRARQALSITLAAVGVALIVANVWSIAITGRDLTPILRHLFQ